MFVLSLRLGDTNYFPENIAAMVDFFRFAA